MIRADVNNCVIHSDDVRAAPRLERFTFLKPEGDHGFVLLRVIAGGDEHYFAMPQAELENISAIADQAASHFTLRKN